MVKCLFRFFAYFLIGLFDFLTQSYKSSFYILYPLSGLWFVNIFSHSIGYLFTFLMVYFETKILSFDVVQFINFFLLFFILSVGVIFEKSLPNSQLQIFMLSSNIFMIFSSYIYLYDTFWVNFYMILKYESNSILLNMDVQFSQGHLLERWLYSSVFIIPVNLMLTI